MQAILDEIKSRGATLVAVTPQLQEHSRLMTAKHGLGYQLLADPGNEYAAALGIRWTLPDDLREAYLELGLDLTRYNGDESWTLPLPTRLVVDPTGTVRAADSGVDHTRRPEPEKTLEDLAALA